MSQKTTGLYRLTQISALYEAFQLFLGADQGRRAIIDQYIRPCPGDRVLDLGCGPASVLPLMSQVDYVGIDANPDHIASATAAHGARGRFIAGDFACLKDERGGSFDLVLGLGLMHHLDDRRVTELASLARAYLAPGGRFVAIDPVFEDGQNRIAYWLAAADSGQNVRRKAGYCDLVSAVFGNCETTVRHNLLRVPYSHCITTASAT